jgi:hypothetical protein
MVTSSVAAAEPVAAPAQSWTSFPRSVGWVLLVCWTLLIPTALVLGGQPSTLMQLEADVASGKVDAVQIAGGLAEDGRGYSVVQVHWRRGLVGYSTDIIEARPRRAAPPLASREDVTAVITEDLGTRLTAWQPGLRVDRVGMGHLSSTFFGWRLPGWLGPVFLVLLVATLLLLVHGPQPRRATRWAWCWLMVMTPVGAVAYLLLAGPTTLVRAPRDPSKRLTGGWAFVLALFLASVFGSSWQR